MPSLDDVLVPASWTPRKAACLDDVVAAPGLAPETWQVEAPDFLFVGRKVPVTKSADLQRILALPRRPRVEPGTATSEALIDYIGDKYSLPEGPCRCRDISEARGALPKPCIKRLNYAQAWMLHEIATQGGLIAHAATGCGKSTVDILAALAMPNCKLALLLVPPQVMRQLVLEYELISQHWKVPTITWHGIKEPTTFVPGAPSLHVMAYTRLSRADNTVFLDNLEPDAIFADECQNIAGLGAVRTGRLLRVFQTRGESVRFCAWSGTLTDDSILDYVHLAILALRRGAPIPIDQEVAKEWAGAIDPEEWMAPPGALLGLCDPGEHVHDGYHRRLAETPGFVCTSGASIDATMEIHERPAPPIPDTPRLDPRAPEEAWPGVASCLTNLRQTWIRPDGEWLLDALSVARCARELACGLFLRWRFPRGETREQIDEWKEARKQWRSELREKLKERIPHMDSPLLCALAAIRAWGRIGDGPIDWDDDGRAVQSTSTEDEPGKPIWRADSWPRWAAIKNEVRPETEVVRLDDYLVQDAVQWAQENRGIIWYSTVGFGTWVAEVSGLPLHAGGPDAERKIMGERGDRSIIASIKSHGTGRDGLQRLFSTQLVAQPPASAVANEQLLGRLSRIGQQADTVTAWFYRHTPELASHVDAALRKAEYVQRTMRAPQKLILGWST